MINKSRGQATIELMLILVMLFIILGYSIQTFLYQENAFNQKRSVLDQERTASIVRTAVESMALSPIGSSMRVFIPPASQAQTIRIVNGSLEVKTNTTVITIPLTLRDVNMSTLGDGNVFIVSHTLSGVIIS